MLNKAKFAPFIEICLSLKVNQDANLEPVFNPTDISEQPYLLLGLVKLESISILDSIQQQEKFRI